MNKKRRSNAKGTGDARGRRRSPPLVDTISDRLQAARLLWSQGRREDAVRAFDAAVEVEGHNVRAWIDAARAHALLYRVDRAERLLNRFRQQFPSQPGVHHLAGEVYGWLKIPAKATECYEHACKLRGVLPGSYVELAGLYLRSGRMDEARDLVQRALRTTGELPAATLLQARLERADRQFSKAESTLRQLLQKLPSDSFLSCHAWADLAEAKDRQGDYDGAMEAIEQCKQIQRSRDAEAWRTSEHVLTRFGKMIDTITADDFARWHRQAQGFSPRRAALLTGFPRSGTTLMEQVLDAHPDLISSEERDFLAQEFFPAIGREFSNDAPVQQVLDQVSAERLTVDRERYFRVMEAWLGEPLGERMHLDKNPAYNPMIPVMLRLFPEARLIVALRDPRDVVISCYLRFLPLNPVSVGFLTLQRAADRYAFDMRAWLRFRELIQAPWCEVRYEDTVADLECQARRMLELLGLEWNPQVTKYRDALQKKQLSSPSFEAVAQPVTPRAIGRWKHYAKYLEPIQDTLAPYVRAFGYD